jgi:hypothetical protein
MLSRDKRAGYFFHFPLSISIRMQTICVGATGRARDRSRYDNSIYGGFSRCFVLPLRVHPRGTGVIRWPDCRYEAPGRLYLLFVAP